MLFVVLFHIPHTSLSDRNILKLKEEKENDTKKFHHFPILEILTFFSQLTDNQCCIAFIIFFDKFKFYFQPTNSVHKKRKRKN